MKHEFIPETAWAVGDFPTRYKKTNAIKLKNTTIANCLTKKHVCMRCDCQFASHCWLRMMIGVVDAGALLDYGSKWQLHIAIGAQWRWSFQTWWRGQDRRDIRCTCRCWRQCLLQLHTINPSFIGGASCGRCSICQKTVANWQAPRCEGRGAAGAEGWDVSCNVSSVRDDDDFISAHKNDKNVDFRKCCSHRMFLTIGATATRN